MLDATDAFDALVAPVSGWGEARIWDHVPSHSPVAPIAWRWFHERGRASAQLSRIYRDVFTLVHLEPDAVPTLADVDWLPERWRHAQHPELPMRSATLGLAVARLAGARTWAEAGELIGLESAYAPRVVRHTLRTLGGDSEFELNEAAFAYARALTRQSGRVALRPRLPATSARDLGDFGRRAAVPLPT
ncbi:hypothetical protein ASF78_08200 [Cellulomonas sp. Leaf334]|nr:hypothetical protein ASF78_08200 [Cellulomonas sp. Leaf334]